MRDFLYKIYKGFPLYSRSEKFIKNFLYKIVIRDFYHKLGGTNLKGISLIKFTKDFLYNAFPI